MTDYNIHWLPNEQIIVERIAADFDLERDMIPSAQVTAELLDEAAQPVPYILDVTELKLTFYQMSEALAAMTRGEYAVYLHPNLKELIVVTEDVVLQLGAKALTQDQYGAVRVYLCQSMDEALAHARAIAPRRAA